MFVKTYYSRAKTINEGQGVIILRVPWFLFSQNCLNQLVTF